MGCLYEVQECRDRIRYSMIESGLLASPDPWSRLVPFGGRHTGAGISNVAPKFWLAHLIHPLALTAPCTPSL